MAASDLNHLKNDYRRRFCRPSRVPDVNTNQNRNMLEILQNCFEEKSLIDDIITSSTKSVFYSTPTVKSSYTQSPSKDCQRSHPTSVSSSKKEASPQGTVEPSEAASISVQTNGISQNVLAADVCSKSTPDLKNSGKKLNHLCAEADEEFYISVGSPTALLHEKPPELQNAISSAQERETYTCGNSVNMLSSSIETSLKTKKRLNFDDKDISKRVERKTNKSEEQDTVSRQEGRKLSEISPKRVQDTECKIQSQVKKSFSTLFLETVKRKDESSPIVRHTAMAPSPTNDTQLLEDEFIIDESDRNFTPQSWITIPKKTRPLKQHTVSSAESTAGPQGQKTREHKSVSPVTLTSDRHLNKAHPEEKSESSSERKATTSCSLIDELENGHRSVSEKAEKTSGNRKTTEKQKQKRKLKTNVVKQPDTGHSENTNMPQAALDKLLRNLDRTTEDCEEMRNGHSAGKETLPVDKMKTKCSTKKIKKESRKKHHSSESKKEKPVPEDMTFTVTRSHRISRRPSDWWVTKAEKSPVHSNLLRNEVSLYHNSKQKPTKKTSQTSKKIAKKPNVSKRQKMSSQASSKVQKFLNVKGSGGNIGHDEVSTFPQSKPLESDKTDPTMEKTVDRSRTTEQFQDQDGITSTENAHLKSQTGEDTHNPPAPSNVDFEESQMSVLEESGPCRLKNHIMSGKNNSVNNEIQENLDASIVERLKVATRNDVHHKLVLPSHTPNVRRTKRIRFKPLEYWRGERVDYKETLSGGLVIGGILSPKTVMPKRKAKGNLAKVNKIDNRKRICLDNVERKHKLVVLNPDIPLGDPFKPTEVKDPETRELILMDLIRPRDTYQFFVEHGELKVYKTLDTPLFSTGKLLLGPYEEKGKQHVGEDILVFYVNVGDLLCTLHETSYIITTGDSFYVPAGNYYNIKNLLNEESILFFTQIKR